MEPRNVSQEAPSASAPVLKKPFMLKRTRFSGPFLPSNRPQPAKPSYENMKEIRHSATPTAQPPVSSSASISISINEPETMQSTKYTHVTEKKGSKKLSNVPPPEIQQAFDSALNSDNYRIWTDKNGVTDTTKGVMLPPGYKKFDHPEFPWICPIRSCRELFDALFGLGKHFNIAHRASRLNDNLDGTLSELGKYDRAEKGDGILHGGYGKPPLLVSKKAISLADDPMVEPSLQRAKERVAKTLAQRQGVARRRSQLQPSDDEEDLAAPDSPPPPPPTRTPTRLQTTGTPRAAATRSVQGLTTAEDNRSYTMWPDDDGQLVQMHGALIPAGYHLDTTVADRPWICPIRSCRYLFKARHELGRHFSTRTHRGIGLNDNLDGTFSVVHVDETNTVDPPYVVSRGRNNTEAEEISAPKVPTYPWPKTCVWVPVGFEGQEVDDTPSGSEPVRRQPTRWQSRVLDLESDEGNEGEEEEDSPADVGEGKRSRDEELEEDSSLEEPAPKRSYVVTLKVPQQKQQQQQQPENPAIVVPGARAIPQSDLEMEDWEVGDQPAPAVHQTPHAFSTSYFSKQVAIPGHQSVSVQVVSISSGTSHVFSANRGKTRICSLASGKVKVQIKEGKKEEGAEEFVIGAGGVFVIGAGRECWVMNRCYIDVRLQVTSCGV